MIFGYTKKTFTSHNINIASKLFSTIAKYQVVNVKQITSVINNIYDHTVKQAITFTTDIAKAGTHTTLKQVAFVQTSHITHCDVHAEFMQELVQTQLQHPEAVVTAIVTSCFGTIDYKVVEVVGANSDCAGTDVNYSDFLSKIWY